MASEIRVNKINSRTGVGTITLSPTGVDFTGIATVATLKATTGIVTTLSVTGTTTLNGNLDLQDDDKILIGTGDDLEIYHNGTDSFIVDGSRHLLVRAGGSGDLYLQSDSKVLLTDIGGNETFIECNDNSDVKLFHNNNEKLATTGVGASVTGTFNVGTGTSITSSSLIVNDVQYPDSGPLSNRNLVINGGMTVSQRGTSFTHGTGPQYTLDRFEAANGSSFNWNSAVVSQSSDGPDGFGNSLKVDVASTSTPTGSHNACFKYLIEAQDLQLLEFGSSGAKSFTLSFWVKSNKTGAYSVQVLASDADKYLLSEYTISSSSTWEKKTFTFVGNTADVIDNNNGTGFELRFNLACGASDITTPKSTWTAAGGGTILASTNQVNLFDNASNEWYMTGVQLEVGEKATPFEHRSFGDELARCQRYFRRFCEGANYAAAPGSGTGTSSTNAFHNVILSPEMRTVPTLAAFSNLRNDDVTSGTTITALSLVSSMSTTEAVFLQATSASGLTQHRPYHLLANNTSSAKLDLSAEL